jgi:hypothetical protein
MAISLLMTIHFAFAISLVMKIHFDPPGFRRPLLLLQW